MHSYSRSLFLVIAILFPLASSAAATEKIRYNGSSTIMKGIMFEAAKQFKDQEGIKFDLKGKSTGYGIEKLLAGECDIAGGGRPLTEAEKAKGLIETKIFIDAYAFIVHKSNPLTSINSDQIRDLLQGKILQWDILGGPKDKNIVILSPPIKSAHFKNAQQSIGFDTLPPNSIVSDMTPNVYKKVRSFPAALGWLSYATVSAKEDIKILKIIHHSVEIEINQANIQSGAYPYQQSMFFFTMGEPQGVSKKFIDFINSDKGQGIITKAGFFLTD